MAYTKTTDFQAKDALASGNPLKIVKGTEIDDEFDAIATADALNLKKDGSSTATASIPMGSNKFTGLGAGSAATDSANLGQIQAAAYQLIGSISGVDTITGSLTPAISSYVAGQKFSFIAAGANTGAVTININGLGAKSITKRGTNALVADDIPSGAVAEIEYDGTQFQLCNLVAQSGGAITTSGLTMATARILGRTTASTGAVEELTVGAGLSLSAGSLSGSAASDSAAGIVELATTAEVQTGTSTTLAPSVSSMQAGKIILPTSIATTSGTAVQLSTTIPSWAKQFTVLLDGVSTNGSSPPVIQLGDSTSYKSSGYTAAFDAANFASGGVPIWPSTGVSDTYTANLFFSLLDASTNVWICSGIIMKGNANTGRVCARLTLTSALTRVQITTVGGTDTFDAGSASIQIT